MNEPTTVREGMIADVEAAYRHLSTAWDLAYRVQYDGIGPDTYVRRDRYGRPYVRFGNRVRLRVGHWICGRLLERLSR